MKELKEEWLQVPEFNRYLVSNTGRVISTARGKAKELKPQQDAIGYLHYRLYPEDQRFGSYGPNRGVKPKLFKAHRLVAETFIPDGDTTLQINHKDGNKHNNVVTNLEYCTAQQNIQHSWDLGMRKGTHQKIARQNYKPLVAIDRLGRERYFQGNIIAKFGMGCSVGAISKSLKTGDEIQRGPARGYTFVRIKELPNHCVFEEVPDIEEKINNHNKKYFSKNWKRKDLI